jgi:sugar phosphate isomerase/epimerase
MMGDGVIDISAIRNAAERAGYSGLYEVELCVSDLGSMRSV